MSSIACQTLYDIWQYVLGGGSRLWIGKSVENHCSVTAVNSDVRSNYLSCAHA